MSVWAPCWTSPGLSPRKSASKTHLTGKGRQLKKPPPLGGTIGQLVACSVDRSYVVAVLGKGKLHLTVPGPHEQIVRVQDMSSVPGTDIVLLRLADKVRWTRYVQAADLDAW